MSIDKFDIDQRQEQIYTVVSTGDLLDASKLIVDFVHDFGQKGSQFKSMCAIFMGEANRIDNDRLMGVIDYELFLRLSRKVLMDMMSVLQKVIDSISNAIAA